MSGNVIGIIYPPPELRNIVDKTAGFVARNGPEFESRIHQNEQNNPKFNFLNPGDPYHAYYKHRVKELQENAASASAVPTAGQKAAKQKEATESSQPAVMIVRDPPPEFQFSADPPTLSALDLDVVKLTAQFVAIHGHSFLSSLMANERKNPLFDFTRPQHGLFSYFTNLTRQYTDILVPSEEDMARKLRQEVEREKTILDKIRYRLEWTKIQEAERKREEEEAERERVQYAQIDWHDFVVVETVDYQPNEQGQFPPPTTPEQVGSRILQQQRIEESAQEVIERQVDTDDMQIDEDEDADGTETEPKKSEAEAMPPPLPPSLDNVLIKKDYNPKASRETAPAPASKTDAWVISPITGERIPADKLQEHVRFGLLDPRWLEERERNINEKMQQEEVFAPGVAIESSLKQLAERRTDIFGSSTEETVIGRKIGEEEKRTSDKVTWDGYSSSAQQTLSAARSRITVEEQIQDIRRRVYPDPEKDKIGPAVVRQPMQNQQPGFAPPQQVQHRQPPPPLQPPTHTHIPSQAPILIPSAAGAFLMPPQMSVPGMYGMPHEPLLVHPMAQPMHSAFPPPIPPVASFPVEDAGPATKKLKTEESLIPEEEFVKQSPAVVTIRVAVPQVSEKSEWNLSGQILNLSMNITDAVSVIKSRIQESVGMPPGKQKLQYEGMYIRDNNTLAFYNMNEGAVIQLQLKERGGRKK